MGYLSNSLVSLLSKTINVIHFTFPLKLFILIQYLFCWQGLILLYLSIWNHVLNNSFCQRLSPTWMLMEGQSLSVVLGHISSFGKECRKIEHIVNPGLLCFSWSTFEKPPHQSVLFWWASQRSLHQDLLFSSTFGRGRRLDFWPNSSSFSRTSVVQAGLLLPFSFGYRRQPCWESNEEVLQSQQSNEFVGLV